MKIHAQGTVLSLAESEREAYYFDRAGRPFAAWEDGWLIARGLSGTRVARRWNNGAREIRPLTRSESQALQEKTRAALTRCLSNGYRQTPHDPRQIEQWLLHSLVFDEAYDSNRFRQVYRPVGILPPDQYNACVIQITEGCRHNKCSFCNFYRGQNFRLKTRVEIRDHIDRIAEFFGASLANRRSIFFGEASGLSAPIDTVLHTMMDAKERLVPKMREFRGFFSFVNPHDSLCRRADDFRQLAEAGMRRLYYGIETGHSTLRGKLAKMGPLEEAEESVRRAKAAGMDVGLIFLIGAGGAHWREKHLSATVQWIQKLPLNERDIIFLSPLRGKKGAGTRPLSEDEKQRDLAECRARLGPSYRIAPYDIREFYY